MISVVISLLPVTLQDSRMGYNLAGLLFFSLKTFVFYKNENAICFLKKSGKNNEIKVNKIPPPL